LRADLERAAEMQRGFRMVREVLLGEAQQVPRVGKRRLDRDGARRGLSRLFGAPSCRSANARFDQISAKSGCAASAARSRSTPSAQRPAWRWAIPASMCARAVSVTPQF
jgi:hypothetical protein